MWVWRGCRSLARLCATLGGHHAALLRPAQSPDHHDPRRRYIDDGLQVQLAPLFSNTQRLAVSLAGLDDLLRSARTEVNLFSRPHRFPSKTYG